MSLSKRETAQWDIFFRAMDRLREIHDDPVEYADALRFVIDAVALGPREDES